MTSAQKFLKDRGERLARIALRRVKQQVQSAAIRKSLQLRRLPGGGWSVYTPYYWAGYYHDGRGPVRPSRASVLVWFWDKRDDPRTAGGKAYPVRATQIRRLTQSQFQQGLLINAQRRAAGAPPYMVVTRRAGPAKGHPFLLNALAVGKVTESLERTAQRAIPKAFFSWLKERKGISMDGTDTAKVRM